jgi:WhiB family transcriptional regulator, redox-sensing transcriptional regulator
LTSLSTDLNAALGAEDQDGNDWMLEARCLDADPEAFFPEKGGSTREAKRICAACPVRDECLQYALDNDERFGIWGGLSERERRRAKRVGPARVARLSA